MGTIHHDFLCATADLGWTPTLLPPVAPPCQET